jgi:hypothetical protein
MDNALANTVAPIFVPKANSLPEVIVKPDGQNNKNVGHSNVGYTKSFTSCLVKWSRWVSKFITVRLVLPIWLLKMSSLVVKTSTV